MSSYTSFGKDDVYIEKFWCPFLSMHLAFCWSYLISDLRYFDDGLIAIFLSKILRIVSVATFCCRSDLM